MIIRDYIPRDCSELADLFYNTVHTINANDYTKEQLSAWASGQVDLLEWNQAFLEHLWDKRFSYTKKLLAGYV